MLLPLNLKAWWVYDSEIVEILALALICKGIDWLEVEVITDVAVVVGIIVEDGHLQRVTDMEARNVYFSKEAAIEASKTAKG